MSINKHGRLYVGGAVCSRSKFSSKLTVESFWTLRISDFVNVYQPTRRIIRGRCSLFPRAPPGKHSEREREGERERESVCVKKEQERKRERARHTFSNVSFTFIFHWTLLLRLTFENLLSSLSLYPSLPLPLPLFLSLFLSSYSCSAPPENR